MKEKQILKLLEDKIEYYIKIRNKNDDEYCKIDDFALGITGEKMTKEPRKRILNKKTHTYLEIRQRTTKFGKKGQIKGKWSSKK